MPTPKFESKSETRTNPEDIAADLVRKGLLPPDQQDRFLRGVSHRQAALEPGSAPDEVVAAARDPRSRTGRYIRVKPLGRGGRSLVWLAWDTDLSRYIALKILISADDPNEVHRFHREAQTAAKLSHPNIVPVHEVGHELDAQGRTLHYIAMDNVEGLPLNRMRLDLTGNVRVIRDCALAADYAHRQNIIHRDIKPSNIMVDRAGHPYLMDFGLAKPSTLPSTLTLSGQILGTPSYMSPEQAQGKIHDLTPRSDVYSLGATLYEMATGLKPFEGEDPYDILRQVIEKEPTPPRKVKPSVSEDLETIILRSLDKDPMRRFATAKDLADDLTRYLNGDPIRARRTSRFSVATRLVKKNKALTSLGAALLLSILVAGGLLTRAKIVARKEEQARVLGERKAILARGAELVAKGEYGPAVEEYLKVLDVPEDESTRRLAELYFARWKESWNRFDYEYAKDYEGLVRALDKDGRFTEALKLEGTIELDSVPSGAVVRARAYAPTKDGRLTIDESPSLELGTAPLKTSLRTGSYLLTLKKEGYPDVLLPLLVGRNSHDLWKVNLYTEKQIGAEFVYVPGGSYISGLDPTADRPEREDKSVPDFFISRNEVTCGEYLEFINDLFYAKGKRAAEGRVPRAQSSGGYWWSFRESKNRFVLPESDWNARWPVTAISWDDAVAYCAWLTERAKKNGEKASFRLPREDEWEKAARGVDGRIFPWGNGFSPRFCKNAESTGDDIPVPEPVGSYKEDCSPYGVMDMAGSAREWCLDSRPDKKDWMSVRGGSWAVTEKSSLHAAYRVTAIRIQVKTSCGIRVVREIAP